MKESSSSQHDELEKIKEELKKWKNGTIRYQDVIEVETGKVQSSSSISNNNSKSTRKRRKVGEDSNGSSSSDNNNNRTSAMQRIVKVKKEKIQLKRKIKNRVKTIRNN